MQIKRKHRALATLAVLTLPIFVAFQNFDGGEFVITGEREHTITAERDNSYDIQVMLSRMGDVGGGTAGGYFETGGGASGENPEIVVTAEAKKISEVIAHTERLSADLADFDWNQYTQQEIDRAKQICNYQIRDSSPALTASNAVYEDFRRTLVASCAAAQLQ